MLLVDDSSTMRRLLATQLRAAGHTVSEASDGVDALDQLRASPYPLAVLLDVVMPRLGGIGVLTQVEADTSLASRHVFTLITSARDAIPPQAVTDLLTRLDVPILDKPLPEETLHMTIAHAERRLARLRARLAVDA